MDEISSNFKEKIDLIDLKKEEDPLLRKNVIEKSKLIYEKEKGFFNIISSEFIFIYIDYKPLYKIEEEILKKKLEIL